MNKIRIIDNKIITYDINKHLFINAYHKLKDITIAKDCLYLYIDGDMELELDCEYNNVSESIHIIIAKDRVVTIFEYKIGTTMKGQIKYTLLENASLVLHKFCAITSVTEKVDIFLAGAKAQIDYHLATLSDHKKSYEINVFHQQKETKSNLINHGLSLKGGSLTFAVNGYIDKGSIQSAIEQLNKIIILADNNKSVINPNLFINEDDVTAKHGATIGRFNNDSLFYLKSRGLNEAQALKMLAKGFLLDIIKIPLHKNNQILNNINTYWRC